MFFSQQPKTIETPPHNGPWLCAESPRSNRRWVSTSKGVDRFEVGTCSGKSGFKCTTPSNFGLVLTAPAKSGAPPCVFLDGSDASAGRVCLALIDSCRPKMIARNGFGQSWMSWPRCLQMRSRQRSMRETFHRREAADGTQRRWSGCASASPKVHGAKLGSDLWKVAVRLAQPVPRPSKDPSRDETAACFPPHSPAELICPPRFPLSPPIRPLGRVGARDQAHQLPPDQPLCRRRAKAASGPAIQPSCPDSHQREPGEFLLLVPEA